jgi:ATP-dependent protease ClpP protease subunit
MPTWNELLNEVESLKPDKVAPWIEQNLQDRLEEISDLRGGSNVVLYASAFLQKPGAPAPLLQITREEVNGFMSMLHGMTWEDGLTLILHTPGGIPDATETIVDYLWSKFDDVEVIVPTYAMSAGTMISLAATRIVMGRQSQLGPIDPQMPVGNGNRSGSARAITEQFERAETEIIGNQQKAHVWAPILQSLGPALLQEAEDALDYGTNMVSEWLEEEMFSDREDAAEKAEEVAEYFKSSQHKSHGRRIDKHEAESQGLEVESLEDDQELQEAVLTAYHIVTIAFEKGPMTKMLINDSARSWIKNVPQPTN